MEKMNGISVGVQTKSMEELIAESSQKSLAKISLPEEAFDPITFEPLTNPVILWCCHSFNWKTLEKVVAMQAKVLKINADESIECPICKRKVYMRICTEVAFGNVIREILEHNKKIE